MMTKKEFLSALVPHITEHIQGGYFMPPDEDDEGYNHDELMGLIEHFSDDCGFDVYENEMCYRTLADDYENLIAQYYALGLVEVE